MGDIAGAGAAMDTQRRGRIKLNSNQRHCQLRIAQVTVLAVLARVQAPMRRALIEGSSLTTDINKIK
jgi:hypothetical protein